METEKDLPIDSQENLTSSHTPLKSQNEILKPKSIYQSGTVIIAVIVILIVLGVGGYFLLNKNTAKSPSYESQNKQNITSVSSPASKSESVKDINSNEKILYEDNGFSFKYPGSLEMSQAYQDAIQWRLKSADRIDNKKGLDVLTLHESTQPLPTITSNGKYTIWNKGYPDSRAEVTINSVKEDSVSLGQNKTSLFKIDCGSDCMYGIVRFTSHKKNYELIYNLNSGDLNQFNEILSSFNFFDPNAKEWRIYISKDGGYSVQYPSNAAFLEKVFTSVDGIRGYSSNLIIVIPQGAGPIEGAFSVKFENIGNTTLDEYLKKNECATISERKQFTLNNEQAEYQSTACGIVGSSDVFVKHKDLLYTIGATSPKDPILATFKFID